MKRKEISTRSLTVRQVSGAAVPVFLISFLLLLFLWMLYGPFGISVVGHEGETVLLGSSDEYWSARWDIYQSLFSFDSYQTVDIYEVPKSKLQTHFTTKVFNTDEAFHSTASFITGNLLYLYQMDSVQYELEIQSVNASTTDGEFLIFDTDYDYRSYSETGYEEYKKNAVYRTNFTIGANNKSVHTSFEYRATTNPAYYFVVCSTPANIYFSFRATVKLTYYDHEDYVQDFSCCTLIQNGHCNITTPSLLQNDSHILLGYVHPSEVKDSYPTIHIIVVMYRMLPPPVQLAVVSLFIVAVAVMTIFGCAYVFVYFYR